jgi:hypothetical protein
MAALCTVDRENLKFCELEGSQGDKVFLVSSRMMTHSIARQCLEVGANMRAQAVLVWLVHGTV